MLGGLSPACRRWTQGFSIRARVDSNRSRSTANWDDTTHYDMDEVEVMDETKGRGHAEPARGSGTRGDRVAGHAGGVSVAECGGRGAGNDALGWRLNGMAICLEMCRNGSSAWRGSRRGITITAGSQYGFGAGGRGDQGQSVLIRWRERTKQDGVLPAELGFPARQRDRPAERLFSREIC